MKAVFPLVALLGLAACSSPVLYAVDSPVAPSQQARIAFSSVEVAEVTLPRYAANPDIYKQAADGGLTAISGVSWADDPAPAMTADLVQVLSSMTGARIAAEPWPFRSYAQVRLDVRVNTMVAREAGDFLLTGQYYVAGQEDGFRERARPFTIAIALPQGFGAAEIAAARSLAVSELARQIVAGGLG